MKYLVSNFKTVPGLGSTPARVNRETGTVFLNADIFPFLSEAAQKFIKLHEEGHYILQTVNEKSADKYALQRFVGTEPESLKKASKILYQTLYPETNPEHKLRYRALVREILIIDTIQFNNQNAYQYLKKMENPQLLQIMTDYLKNKGIDNVNQLTDDEREGLITDMMLSPEIQGLIEADMHQHEKMSDFGEKLKAGFKKLVGNEKVKAAFQDVAGNYISKLGKGLGLSPNADLGAINNAVYANTVNQDQTGGGKEKDNGGTPPGPAGIKTTTETKKTPKWLVPVIIVVVVIGIGVAVYFAIRKKK